MIQNNYNPYSRFFKDERLEYVNEVTTNNSVVVFLKLNPKDEYTCEKCGSKEIIKFGKKDRIIKEKVFTDKDTLFNITLHRFKCKNCGKMFVDKILDVETNSNISISTKVLLMDKLKNRITFKEAAEQLNISHDSAVRIFDELYEAPKNKLSETICFDEIKNSTDGDGNYCFVILDPIKEKIIDILEDRRRDKLETYFFDIPFEERNNVKYIVTDMYEPYRIIKETCFKNATHVVDEFHYTRYITDALTTIRINTMHKYSEESNEYKILKKYWRLICIRKWKIKDNCKLYNNIRKTKTSLFMILDDILNIDSTLNESYNITQEFYKGMDNIKYEEAKEWLDGFIINMINSDIDIYKSVARTFINWENEIVNSFIRFGDKRLNNGPIEGINSYINELVKICHGIHLFKIYRKRLIYTLNKDAKYKFPSKNAKP